MYVIACSTHVHQSPWIEKGRCTRAHIFILSKKTMKHLFSCFTWNTLLQSKGVSRTWYAFAKNALYRYCFTIQLERTALDRAWSFLVREERDIYQILSLAFKKDPDHLHTLENWIKKLKRPLPEHAHHALHIIITEAVKSDAMQAIKILRMLAAQGIDLTALEFGEYLYALIKTPFTQETLQLAFLYLPYSHTYTWLGLYTWLQGKVDCVTLMRMLANPYILKSNAHEEISYCDFEHLWHVFTAQLQENTEKIEVWLAHLKMEDHFAVRDLLWEIMQIASKNKALEVVNLCIKWIQKYELNAHLPSTKHWQRTPDHFWKLTIALLLKQKVDSNTIFALIRSLDAAIQATLYKDIICILSDRTHLSSSDVLLTLCAYDQIDRKEIPLTQQKKILNHLCKLSDFEICHSILRQEKHKEACCMYIIQLTENKEFERAKNFIRSLLFHVDPSYFETIQRLESTR